MKNGNYNKLDESIIIKLHQKDEEAFAVVYKFYEQKIFNIAYCCFKNRHTAEDIVQNTFILIYQYLDKISSVQALTIWVNKIAYQRCMHELRRKQVMVIPEDENMMESIEDLTVNRDIIEELNRKELYKLIEESLMKMEDKLKIVGILRYYEDLTTKEIAEIMDIPEGTVKSRLNLIKKNLRFQFRNYGYGHQHKRSDIYVLSGISFAFNPFLKRINANITKIKSGLRMGAISGVVTATIVLGANYMRSATVQPYFYISYDREYTKDAVNIDVETSYKYQTLLINDEPGTKISENGNYQISLMVDGEKIQYGKIHIENIDKQPPLLLRKERVGNHIKLFLSDTESGIDFHKILYFVDNELSTAFTYDEDEKAIIFSANIDQQNVFTIQDKAGNVIELIINTTEIM